MSYQSILVPLDGSPLAEEALPWARFLAAGLNLPLRIVRVVAPEAPNDSPELATNYLKELVAHLDIEVETAARVGRAADEILAAATEAPEPLVVLTTHGRSGVERWLVGSVAERVVRGVHASVLVLHSGTPANAQPALRQIVVPLDGSALAEAALAPAAALAGTFGARLRLVQVAETAQLEEIGASASVASLREVVPPLRQGLIDVSGRYLESMRAKAGLPPERVDVTVLHGEVIPTLLHELESAGADLAVMATHGRSGVRRWLLGSVAEGLLQRGTLPVLMVHQPHLAGDAAYP